jgi:hypothetical protein
MLSESAPPRTLLLSLSLVRVSAAAARFRSAAAPLIKLEQERDEDFANTPLHFIVCNLGECFGVVFELD